MERRARLACIVFSFLFLSAVGGIQKVNAPTLQVLFSRYGNESGDVYRFFGNSLTGVDDQNGDGYDDVLIANIFETTAYLYLGGSPMDTVPAMVFHRDDPGFAVQVVKLGNVTGNGKTGFAIVSGSGVYIYEGGKMDTVPLTMLPIYGYVTGVGDVNGDGYADVLVSQPWWNNNQGKAWLYFGGNAIDTIPDWIVTGNSVGDWFGVEIAGGGDLNHDGFKDFVIGAWGRSVNGAYSKVYYGGSTVSETPRICFSQSKLTQRLGVPFLLNDLNGDLLDELCFTSSSDTCIYLYYGKDSMTTAPDLKLRGSPYTEFVPGMVASLGDVNGDGYNDFALGTPTSWNRLGEVLVYLGGPMMKGDYAIGWTGFYGPWEGTGQVVSWCGDVNHDSLNDIMFSSYDPNFPTRNGKVDIFAGDRALVVGVKEKTTTTEGPSDLDLMQNYPNPFNPSTEIVYSSNTSQPLSLKIYNIRGQLVKTIFQNMIHGNGQHSVKWDGRDQMGTLVASGVYISRLESPTKSISRKMLIVR